MKCRALVADIDGTLTLSRDTYELSLEALTALRRIRHLGVRVALATANGLDYALSIARYLGRAQGSRIPRSRADLVREPSPLSLVLTSSL